MDGEVDLVEREQELATLRSAVAAGARAVVVTGPAGVGKSRLLREAVSAWAGAGGMSAWAGSRAMASPTAPVPFGVVDDLLLAAAGTDTGTADAGGYPHRQRLLALRQLPGPLIVEDLQWADADSLAVLVDLVRGDGPTLLASAREEPHRPLVAALAAFASTPRAETISLTGLSTGGVVALIEAIWGVAPPVRTALQVRRRTDGLPYWVEELARGTRTPADLTESALPGMASAALHVRVAEAGAGATEVAEVAAVLGERVDLALLLGVLDQPMTAVLPRLRRLVDAWVLTEVAADQFAFRHELTREAVAARVPQAQRRRWHAQAYAVVAAAGAGDARLAWHAAEAGRDADVVAPARRGAATLLAAGSGAEALRLAEMALAAGAEPAWPVHRIAAQAAYLAGWFDEAEPHVAAWREGARQAGQAGEAAEADCLRASLRWRSGDIAGQWEALQDALAQPGLAGPALAQVRAARSNALQRAERYEEAVTEAGLVLAAAGPADPARRAALISKGTAISGHRGLAVAAPDVAAQEALHRQGLALLEQAEQESEAAGDLLNLGRAINNSLGIRLFRLPAAEQWDEWTKTRARAERLGLHASLGKIVRHGIDLAVWTGEWERGWRAVIGRLPEEAEPVERVVLAAKAALLALEADHLAEATRLAERSTRAAAGMDQFWAVLYIALLEVAFAARTGTPALTTKALRRYRLAVSPEAHRKRGHRAWEAAEWALIGGVPPATVRAFLTATVPAGLPAICADEAELALAEAAGDDAAAIAAGDRLRNGASQVTAPYGAVSWGSALTQLGRSLLRTGRVEAAAACAEQACAVLANWPGHRLAAAQELRRAATGPTRRLTARERQVLDLIVAGLTNREIAERLGVAARTVAVHVSRVLAKTGSASRTELAVRQLRAGGG
ncbi:AAA family ATPase [Natronosporangium hydrolyticum]|uniref:AAA family ATPase n=1 Tax=Natronosporangium hydrolyticum TaxID=2811111 RepID=A0A895YHL3_9ACTN|nr:LuxR family transcriptional regulator [Natronosporangium hydrolyticum]QSB15009.1 AAA family ATPase [Natronosporangium hydrolyticum]